MGQAFGEKLVTVVLNFSVIDTSNICLQNYSQLQILVHNIMCGSHGPAVIS